MMHLQGHNTLDSAIFLRSLFIFQVQYCSHSGADTKWMLPSGALLLKRLGALVSNFFVCCLFC